MIEKIQHATASSPEGARGLVKGVLACAFQNMAFMLPTGLLYLLVKDLLAGSTSGRTAFYLLGCAGCFALILLTTWFQYNGTYFTTYKESGTRRLTLQSGCASCPCPFSASATLPT
jgi:ATP-binding cassette subfamily B protein IrtB